MYIVSACLLGANCKYNGGNNDNEDVKDLCEGHRIITVCPETEGGLRFPRPPAEQVGERVIDREGKDLTDAFTRGAEICLNKVLSAAEEGEEPELAILKANSPSCGSCRIYDGTLSGTLTDGDGVFTKLLKERGIKVITENDIKQDIDENANKDKTVEKELKR